MMNSLAYALTFLITIFILHVERKDWNYHEHTLKSGDCQTLIAEIMHGCTAEERSIKWRRSIFLSVVIAFALWFLVGFTGTRGDGALRCLPPFQYFAMSVVIIFCVLYFQFNYYSYHVFGEESKKVIHYASEIKRKCMNNGSILS